MGTIFSASSEFSSDVGERSIATSSKPLARHVRNGFTPNTGVIATGRWCGPRGEKVFIETGDGKRLAAIHVDVGSSKGNNSKKAAAIIFHGNGMTHEDMGDFAWAYASQGVSILAITLRGYGESGFGDGNVPDDGEQGMYLDAAAAVDFMLLKGFDRERLVAHGFSLGGSMAAAAALHHNLGGLVLDHTFTSALAETSHVGQDLFNLWLPAWFLRGVGRAAFQPGLSVDLGKAGVVITDGLSSVNKLRSYGGQVVIIYGDADHMMPSSFADDFEEAFSQTATRILIPGGGHDCEYLCDEEKVRLLYQGLHQCIL